MIIGFHVLLSHRNVFVIALLVTGGERFEVAVCGAGAVWLRLRYCLSAALVAVIDLQTGPRPVAMPFATFIPSSFMSLYQPHRNRNTSANESFDEFSGPLTDSKTNNRKVK